MTTGVIDTDNEDGALSPAAFGVESSLSGGRWQWRPRADSPVTARLGSAIAQRYDLPEIVGRVMVLRGIQPENAETFLDPTLRALMPDPFCLKDMDIAAKRLAEAIRNQETVAVFGDYDVDGACSTALLATLMRDQGCPVLTYIPDRMTEGYGPNAPALLSLADQGATLVVCLDCGTAAGDILDCLKGRADVVVIDHHKSEGQIPDIVATVNPNRSDCGSQLNTLCAAALTFFAAVATVRELRRTGWFSEQRPAPDLLRQLDIVALATVCDVMPLTGLNRAFVRQGIRAMAGQARLGLRHLSEVAGLKSAPSAFTCGYTLGPRINAGGRIAESDLGVRLLTTQDAEEAQILSQRLDAINRRRQEVEADILEPAIEQAQLQNDQGNAVLVLADAKWHAGVVGIVASRIKERFNRPVLVCAEQDDGQLKGSGRSVPGLDLGAAVIAAREHGLLTNGGGHMMAAGFSLSKLNLPAFHAFLNQRLANALCRPDRTIYEIDAPLSPRGISVETAKAMDVLAPFGQGNEEPLISVSDVQVLRLDRIGSDGTTIRLILAGDGNRSIKALMFRVTDDSLLAVFEDRTRPFLTVIGHLRHEVWQGREGVTFFIRDVAVCRQSGRTTAEAI
ncbi:single-stranded-DNA-specific exonuclease RecJ [Acetobacter oeni]|uniref:Single-stranded-DNA-specific exonuclease RecJ n=1 Tax=Acetobacter oeni TaxID=304077 RepID=A0A511XIG7_9PROT|nr:single-stranded-DNA-specific exonuclease RecJ [Acetobacter oeni]MBB3881462.1 single-stranded-DNA-specific exonuclease [Acetobacter oeni]NHO18327.1 single-stranded-DNA-specific exonuclease RecJ [Acetobacter oeni]GBR10912.1 single-stranded-DNA-specific exonuclease RecJ [Acetobacter oeni LMG 21952]GEN62739.1 single-stranded-DNA-specific exonuclease RecJ [Acetobacter oeni]